MGGVAERPLTPPGGAASAGGDALEWDERGASGAPIVALGWQRPRTAGPAWFRRRGDQAERVS